MEVPCTAPLIAASRAQHGAERGARRVHSAGVAARRTWGDRVADAFRPLGERRRVGGRGQFGGLRTAAADHGGRDEHRGRDDDRSYANDCNTRAQGLRRLGIHNSESLLPIYLKTAQSQGFCTYKRIPQVTDNSL